MSQATKVIAEQLRQTAASMMRMANELDSAEEPTAIDFQTTLVCPKTGRVLWDAKKMATKAGNPGGHKRKRSGD